jgi:hypothetical protein
MTVAGPATAMVAEAAGALIKIRNIQEFGLSKPVIFWIIVLTWLD